MENRIPEFEEYLVTLAGELELETNLKENICKEIRQNLYDKFNELLIKGSSIDFSIFSTLEAFEDPIELATMFNNIHKERIDLGKAIGFVYDRKAILVAVISSLLMAFII